MFALTLKKFFPPLSSQASAHKTNCRPTCLSLHLGFPFLGANDKGARLGGAEEPANFSQQQKVTEQLTKAACCCLRTCQTPFKKFCIIVGPRSREVPARAEFLQCQNNIAIKIIKKKQRQCYSRVHRLSDTRYSVIFFGICIEIAKIISEVGKIYLFNF